MIPELERLHLDRHTRGIVRHVLSLGPWAWPREGQALDRARAILPQGPPEPRPGQTLLVTVSPSTTSLWALGQGKVSAGQGVSFGRRAREAWSTVACTLPRSVPVLWTSVQPLERMPIEAHWLVSVAEPGTLEVRETVIDGSSFGLSFLLAMASLVFNRPLPQDVAASAEIDATGAVGAVEAIDRKIGILLHGAPRVRRMLVASRQGQEARQAARGAIEIVEVRTAAEALERVFGRELSTLLTLAGQDPARRTELVRSFFQLAIGGRSAMVDWTPVAEAARLASEQWSDLQPDQRQELSFVRRVAARHEGADVQAQLPSRTWLDSLPAPVRLDVLAHVVQQSADTSDPEPQRAMDLAQPYVVRGTGAFVQHLRLVGAVGRLLAFTGRLSEALVLQTEAARGLQERMEPTEISYPLSEWFRLAGALGDQSAFDEAEELRARAAHMQAPDKMASPYVALARCRAGVLLGHDPSELAAQLHALCTDLTLPSHIRGSATRWLLRFGDPPGRAANEFESALRLHATAPGRGARIALRYVLLIELDRAVQTGDTERANEVVRRMADQERGLMSNLLSRAPDGDARLDWLTRVYPY